MWWFVLHHHSWSVKCSNPTSKATRRFSSCLRLCEEPAKTSENLRKMSCTSAERRTHQAAFHLKSATFVIPNERNLKKVEEIWRNPTASWTFFEQFHCPLADSKLLHGAFLVSSQGTLNVSGLNRIVNPKPFPNAKLSIRIHPHCLDLWPFLCDLLLFFLFIACESYVFPSSPICFNEHWRLSYQNRE